MNISWKNQVIIIIISAVLFSVAAYFLRNITFEHIVIIILTGLCVAGLSFYWRLEIPEFTIQLSIPIIGAIPIRILKSKLLPSAVFVVVLIVCLWLAPRNPIGKELYFGLMPDTGPFSYENGTVFNGYCNDLMTYLNEQTEYQFETATVSYSDRFARTAHDNSKNLVPKEQLVIECGAITITKERYDKIFNNGGGKFSDPFFMTGAKLLIKENEINAFDESKPPLKNATIAVLANTTTNYLVRYVFTSSTIKDLINREKILNSLNSKKPDSAIAYVSDDILLRWFYVNNQGGRLNDSYEIRPKEGFLSYETYGIIVYGFYDNYKPNWFVELAKKLGFDLEKERGIDGTKNLLINEKKQKLFNFINSWIKSDKGRKACQQSLNKLQESLNKLQDNASEEISFESQCIEYL